MLVRIERCGVCHSDLHMQDGYFALGEGKTLDVREGRTLPFTLGHEIAGVVERAGPGAAAAKPGAKVAVYPWIGCGDMRRLQGRRGKPLLNATAISASRSTAALPRMCWCRIRAI